MHLYTKILPEYFEMLDFKNTEFRQFEDITLENTETHERRVFRVTGIRGLYSWESDSIKIKFPNVPWNPQLPVFAIGLGDEIVSVPNPAGQAADIADRKCFEIPVTEKTWHGVGD